MDIFEPFVVHSLYQCIIVVWVFQFYTNYRRPLLSVRFFYIFETCDVVSWPQHIVQKLFQCTSSLGEIDNEIMF